MQPCFFFNFLYGIKNQTGYKYSKYVVQKKGLELRLKSSFQFCIIYENNKNVYRQWLSCG